jgi:transcriptional regulator with XRE-family HTH domain
LYWSFADLLRRHRNAAGLTQEALAERASLSVEAIGSLEAGRRQRPRTFTVRALADALHLSGDDRELFEAAARGPRAGTAPIAPIAAIRQLPPGINDFSGRGAEVRSLIEAITRAVDPIWSPAVAVAAVTGMGGIGKTALAVHVAHRVTGSFPDGQLYVDLRGFGPGEPMRPVEALGSLLRTLGAAEADLPADADQAAARYRSALAGRRFLVVLDNATDTAHVTPLLPGVVGSAVVVTSRRLLVGLPVVQHLSLDPLADDEAVDLLAQIVGPPRVTAEPAASLEVVRHCDGLPLAIRIAAARLATRPGWTVADLADRLGRESRRLDELTGDNLGVRASFAVSLAELARSPDPVDNTAAEVFALLGLPDSSDLATRVAARLCDLPPDLMEPALERLADVHLLESVRPSRYRLHDLLRLFSREEAARTFSVADRDAALSRALDLYVAMAWRADELAGTLPMSAEVVGPGWTDEAADVTQLEAALDWLDDERADIVAAVRRGAAGSERDRTAALRLALGFNTLGVLRRRWIEWRDVNRAVLGIAGSAADPVALGLVHYDLGLSLGEIGDHTGSAHHFPVRRPGGGPDAGEHRARPVPGSLPDAPLSCAGAAR